MADSHLRRTWNTFCFRNQAWVKIQCLKLSRDERLKMELFGTCRAARRGPGFKPSAEHNATPILSLDHKDHCSHFNLTEAGKYLTDSNKPNISNQSHNHVFYIRTRRYRNYAEASQRSPAGL
jgi:hypothetical protein